jgi:D-alanyl-D-alanine carboxypeptidase
MAVFPVLLLSLGLLTPQDDFDRRMQGEFARIQVPGAMVRVVRNGKTVYNKVFGVADLATKAPVKDTMGFEIGSCSKQFAATCALMLVQEGKLKLDEKLGDILPQTPTAWHAATVDQILHHMSGIPDYEEIAGYDFYNTARTRKEIIDQASKKPLDFKPGERYNYSNTGYFLISLIVEKRSGIPLAQFLKKRIFDPLGMKHTYADPKASGAMPMMGYHSRSGARKAQPPIAWTSTLGAGGIVSTLDDLTKWDEALYTEKLLKKELRDKLWTPGKLNNGNTNFYCYGWLTSRYRGVLQLDHSGQTNGFTCWYRRFPEQHCAVWSVVNTYGGDVFGLNRLAAIKFIPELNYAKLPIPKDPAPERTRGHVELLHAAFFGSGYFGGVSPEVKDLLTTTPDKADMEKALRASKTFRFIRVTRRKLANGDDEEDYLYRQAIPSGDKFWVLGISKGVLVALYFSGA